MKSFIPLKDFREIRREQSIPVREIEENTQWKKIGIDAIFSFFHGFPIPLNPSLMQSIFNIIFRHEVCLNFSLFESCGDFMRSYFFERIGSRSQIEINIAGDDSHVMIDIFQS